ncbi:hypothetical protein SSX86_028455 [Deinandra increscens subsp. villosa]|uniref:Beta-glucosidase n=1 Tax=Deinandra increscens subsp. villosa TaxID=3103831 RepID=A0AAP0CD20_9ASTR
MGTPFNLFLLIVLGASSIVAAASYEIINTIGANYSSAFPRNFLFGSASSSYQYEGAYLADGKGLSNWDMFSHKPGNIADGSNGDTAVDHYHLYLKDVDLMDYIGINTYRFSISWARILPKGRFGNVNIAGIKHYDKLINALIGKGIQPFVSLTHYDIPQELEDRYGGWLSPQIQKDFAYYASLCFKYYGDRVKYWITINEPNVVAIRGYRSGIYPPARCSATFGNCSSGDSEREPLIVAHNMILSHSAAVGLYRAKYQGKQKGNIGIAINAVWYEPISNSSQDKLAAERAQSFYMNWFLDPILFGKYPEEMKSILGSLLPEFSYDYSSNGLDFIGINHYTSFYAKDCLHSTCVQGPGISKTEGYYLRTAIKDNIPIGESTAVDWLYVYPEGMEKMVTYLKNRFNNTPMFITENGDLHHIHKLYEGAYLADGKGLSNWDMFSHKPGNIADGSNGDTAVDHYHLYLVSALLHGFTLSNGIQPFVSLTHYDIPQELEDRYGGWLSPQIQKDFAYYASLCFKYYGDRVKYWITINEPNVVAIRGYRSGIYPPARCSATFGNCSSGDSEREPLIVAHNMILSHSAAVGLYRTKYQGKQKGNIGIAINAVWYEPISNSSQDKLAAERAQSFYMNWFLDPILFGKYPEEMKSILGSLLPEFSYDYSSNGLDFIVDWLYVYPEGMEKMVTYLKNRFNNTPMFITENGFGVMNQPDLSINTFLNDDKRVEYMKSYLNALVSAIRKGADVRGYIAWSLLDNFEWLSGYTIRFGLYHVDYATLKRTPKSSAEWYKQFIFNFTSFEAVNS